MTTTTTTPSSLEEEEAEVETKDTLCSILNVIIDHSMEAPSPLEPREWCSPQRAHLRVPIIRVFGPILRTTTPRQSACLYIHGAFPYLLARPVWAGPDGSLRRVRPLGGNVDWDDLESVQAIADTIASTLETSLQSLDMGDKYKNTNNKEQKGENKDHPFIRQVTVVQGRGFYTYCPGPPAPFLRVEYYNPKLRWKVKLILEKGLEVPMMYHPDPTVYDRPMEPPGDTLQFNCYEAHIPYTMQFFKDKNLAGMSYIHISNGRFRSKLPERYFTKRYYRSRDKPNDDDDVTMDAVFLKSNTPKQFTWDDFTMDDFCTPQLSASPTKDTTAPPTVSFQPPKKQTSSDVELDCTVDDLRNVETVLKTLPSEQDERDGIQWRAVPSLQEIWRQERRRMAKLLPPQFDFLSQPPLQETADRPLTLNPKKTNPNRSGARLAAKGMWSLVGLTEGLREDFLRVLQDILERHVQEVKKADQALRNRDQQPQDHSSVSKRLELTPDMDEAVDALATLANDVEEEEEDHPPENLTPDWEEAIGALGSLDETPQSSLPRQPVDEELGGYSAGSQVGDHEEELIVRSPASMVGGMGSPPLSYSCSQEMQDASATAFENIDLSEYCQRLELGDGVVDGPGQEFEDFIDPETLLPYDELYFGQERCRIIFRVETDIVGTDRVCGGKYSNCARHAQYPMGERAKIGYYKTVSSGACVDGILNDSHIGLDDDDEDGKKLERELTALATLTQIQDAQPPVASQPAENPNMATQFSQVVMEDDRPFEPSNSRDSDDESDDEATVDIATQKTVSTVMASPDDCESQDVSNQQCEISYPASVTPRAGPPSHQTVLDATVANDLHRRESSDKPPAWLIHASKYTSSREGKDSGVTLLPYVCSSEGISIQTSTLPPTRDKVEKWCKKNVSQSKANNKRTRSTDDANGSSRQGKKKILEIDSNSRKIVATEQSGDSNPLMGSDFQCNIEDVKWGQSQPWHLTMTQQTQNESEPTIEAIPANPPIQEEEKRRSQNPDSTYLSGKTQGDDSVSHETSQNSGHELDGIGNQGGRIHVAGGGGLKAKTRPSQGLDTPMKADRNSCDNDALSNSFLPSPISFMSIEIHVQCRTGSSRLDSKKISMAPDSSKDRIFLVAYIFGIDPGGGESLDILSRGGIFVPLPTEDFDRELQVQMVQSSISRATLGATAPLNVECVKDERGLLLRLASIVRMKDPDMLLSWDTQGAGIGYLIERGAAIGNGEQLSNDGSSAHPTGIDMVRLLGRTPHDKKSSNFMTNAPPEKSLGIIGDEAKLPEGKWRGSGLGSDWDEKVGAGAAAASIVGRLVFACWKIVSEEVKHANASYLPAVVAAVLNKRIPHHDDLTLTRWYASRTDRWRVLNHKLVQACAGLLLFDALDIVGRAGEAARLSGVEFSQSFPGIRGSQYKVEGVLLRALQSLRSDERGSRKGRQKRGDTLTSRSAASGSLSDDTKTQSQSPWKLRREAEDSALENRHYFFFSPSLADTNKQEALEVQALTLEPQSGHYEDPVVVCDFTALYPSLMIAYNLCYSTCVGKLEYHSTRSEMKLAGRTCGRVGPITYPERRSATVLSHHFKSLDHLKQNNFEPDASNDRAYVAPTGTMYVSENVLKGVLPQVLDEMLTTRAMLKKAAKEYKKHVNDLPPSILRQLEARQLALKYVANVTYGYTSATFSGRCAMPLLADTIVECGRKTLRKAINLANRWGRENGKWRGCNVIYGDTDSLFVRLPGRSHVEAFQFGEELCDAVTADNPPPVQLKLEKVYLGSIMQTMKRYCGMKFESKKQKKPVFEAKGLETVRRDQCALTQKVLRNALITLFRDGVKAVRDYLFRQWSLIFSGQLPVSDFVLTGRVRSRYRGGREGPVQAVLARRIGEADPGRIVRHRERLPYVIVATPGLTFRLKDCVLTPLELLERWDAYAIHSAYYIEKHVNASLQRCLGLAPHYVDINSWYRECPKPRRRIHFWPVRSKTRAMITAYFGSDVCSLCHRRCLASGRDRVVVCVDCRQDRIKASQSALLMLNKSQKLAHEAAGECSKCNQCFEDAGTFASVRGNDSNGRVQQVDFSKPLGAESLQLPLSNCVCIDCPTTYLRHRLRELEIEATATCEVLGLL